MPSTAAPAASGQSRSRRGSVSTSARPSTATAAAKLPSSFGWPNMPVARPSTTLPPKCCSGERTVAKPSAQTIAPPAHTAPASSRTDRRSRQSTATVAATPRPSK
jgi:hypothetical protein